MLALPSHALAVLLGIVSFAQMNIDLSPFASILFLFLGLGSVALAIALALIVIKIILDFLGLDILGLARTVFKGGKGP